jgi:acyl carrier protein
MALTLASLREFLDRELGVDSKEIAEDTALFSSGVIDSLSALELVQFIAREGEIKVNAVDITLDNLDSVQRILAFVARKRT